MAGVIGNAANAEDATWANSAAAATVVNLDYAQEVSGPNGRGYAVTIYNPSTVTALTVKAQGKETFAGTARYADILPTSWAVPPASTKQFYVDPGFLAGEGGRLVLTNDTVLGGADAFTAKVRVRQI